MPKTNWKMIATGLYVALDGLLDPEKAKGLDLENLLPDFMEKYEKGLVHDAIQEALKGPPSGNEEEVQPTPSPKSKKVHRADNGDLERLIIAGHQLSNIAYNLAQVKEVDERFRISLDAARQEWDSAFSKYKKLP